MVSSVFITVGDPDTPWHPHFFRVTQRLTEDIVAADPSDSPRLGDVRMASLVIQRASELVTLTTRSRSGMSSLGAGRTARLGSPGHVHTRSSGCGSGDGGTASTCGSSLVKTNAERLTGVNMATSHTREHDDQPINVQRSKFQESQPAELRAHVLGSCTK